MAFLMLSTQSLFAAPGAVKTVVVEDFNFDATAFEAEFAALDQIEDMVLKNQLGDIAELEAFAASNQVDLGAFDAEKSIMATKGFNWSNFDWPSGLWGFLCCPIGFFVVITNSNKTSDQKVSFWIGWAASVVLNAITAPFYYARGI